MIKIVRKINPFSSCEIEYLESWLTDMARQGLFLDSIILWFASFAVGEPKNRRYRILPKNFGSIRDEEKDFYSQQGWNYDLSVAGLNIFYTDNEEAEELFTDTASFRSYTKKYAAIEIFIILTLPLLYYWWFINRFGTLESTIPTLHQIHEIGLMLTLCITILFLLAIFYLVRMMIAAGLLVIKIKRNIMLTHDKPYKKVARLYKMIAVVTIVALIVFPISMIVSHNVLGTSISYADTVKYQGAHPVMMKEIDLENWSIVQECIDSEVWYEDIEYTIDNYWDGLFKRIVSEDVRINETAVHGISYIATYYNARSAGIARRYLKEDILDVLDKDVTMDDIKIKCDGVDYAGYYASTMDSFQYLYVLNGTQLETVVYKGDKNLKDYIKIYVIDISNK